MNDSVEGLVMMRGQGKSGNDGVQRGQPEIVSGEGDSSQGNESSSGEKDHSARAVKMGGRKEGLGSDKGPHSQMKSEAEVRDDGIQRNGRWTLVESLRRRKMNWQKEAG